MPNHLLDISTQVVEADTFTVDDVQYELKGLVHLSPAEEVKVSAMFARFNSLSEQMASAGTQAKAESFARQVRDKRHELLAAMTTCPLDLIKRIPLPAQIGLMDAVGEQFEAADNGKGREASGGDGGDGDDS